MWVETHLEKNLEIVGVKPSSHLVKVSLNHRCYNCSNCGHKVPKTLSVRTHFSPKLM